MLKESLHGEMVVLRETIKWKQDGTLDPWLLQDACMMLVYESIQNFRLKAQMAKTRLNPLHNLESEEN